VVFTLKTICGREGHPGLFAFPISISCALMVDTHPEWNIVCDVEVRQCFWSEGVWNMHEDMHY